MLRRMFGSKGNEVTRHTKKLHKECRHNLYVSPDVIGAMKTKWNAVGRAYRDDGRDGNCVQNFGPKT